MQKYFRVAAIALVAAITVLVYVNYIRGTPTSNDVSADPVALATPPELPKLAPNPEAASAQSTRPIILPRAELLDIAPIAEVVELPATARPARPQPVAVSTTAPARPAAPAAEKRTHVVQFGESLWTISKKYLGNGELYSKLAEANGITVKDKIRLGQVLLIPDVNAPIPALAKAPEDEADHEDRGTPVSMQGGNQPASMSTAVKAK